MRRFSFIFLCFLFLIFSCPVFALTCSGSSVNIALGSDMPSVAKACGNPQQKSILNLPKKVILSYKLSQLQNIRHAFAYALASKPNKHAYFSLMNILIESGKIIAINYMGRIMTVAGCAHGEIKLGDSLTTLRKLCGIPLQTQPKLDFAIFKYPLTNWSYVSKTGDTNNLVFSGGALIAPK